MVLRTIKWPNYVEPRSPEDQSRASAGDAAPLPAPQPASRGRRPAGVRGTPGGQSDVAEEVGSRFQGCGSLRPPALPGEPSLRPGFVSPAAAPVSSCWSCQMGRQSNQEPEFQAPQSGDSAGSSADTSRHLPLGLPPGGPPASDIPWRSRLSCLETPPPTPAGLGSLRGPLCPSGPGGWPPAGDSAEHPRAESPTSGSKEST